MQGALSNLDAVERWFLSNESPYYTLSYYSTASPTGQGQVIGRNTKEGDIGNAWLRLRSLIMDQTGFGRAQLHVLVYDTPGSANTPKARTNIDILSGSTGPAQVAGIGSIPQGYLSKADVMNAIDHARERWELEARIQALEATPEPDFSEKMVNAFERIGSTPVGAMIMAKFLGAPMPMPQPVNGTQEAKSTDTEEQEDVNPELDDLEELARANGMTLKQFLSKTATLAKDQPAVVAMLAKS